jgi:plastocyanin
MSARRLGRGSTIVLALLVPAIALVTVVVTLTVTSDGTSVAAGDGPRAAPRNAITIKNFQFSPDPVVVDAGTALVVTNADGTAHTVTARDGAFDTGDLDGGATKTISVAKPGTYKYFCDIHNYMTGTIEVR